MKTDKRLIDLDLLSYAVRSSKADETSIVCLNERRVTSRFANGRAHQNLAQDDLTIWIMVHLGQRVGVSISNVLDRQAIRRSIDMAIAIARLAPPDPRTAPMPHRQAIRTLPTAYDASTEAFSTPERFRLITGLIDTARHHGCELSGSLMTEASEMAVANSHGLSVYQRSTVAALKTITIKRHVSGFASSIAVDVCKLAADRTLARALDKCTIDRTPDKVEPGTYDVILEPEAVGDLVMWLGYIGFGAKAFYEKTSFLSGRIGEQIMHRRVTIEDDPLHPEGLPTAFDFEGVPKRRVKLIDAGVAKSVVFDSAYARLYRRDSTGHAMAPDDTEGPLPLHPVVAPGETTLAQMIRSVSRGILITRFHYVNGLLKPRAALMTGLTRDGTFLIRRGKIDRPVRNLRFTESIVDAFRRVTAISRDRRLVGDPTADPGACLAPAMLIPRFAFTGTTR